MDICPPMKNGMRGHLPPKELQGWTFAPSLFVLKFPFKTFILAKVAFIIKTPFFLKVAARGGGGLMSYTRTGMLVMMYCNIFMNKNQNTFK